MEQSSNTEETAALFAARRLEVKVETDADSNPPPKKKRKLQAESDTVKSTDALAVAPGVATAVAVVSEVSLRVACLDGTTLDVTLPERGLVREVKRIAGQVRLACDLRLTALVIFFIDSHSDNLPSSYFCLDSQALPPPHPATFCSQLCDIDPSLIELFVDGKEDSLPDTGRLDELELGEGSVVFMIYRVGWRWETCGNHIALSDDGLVATKIGNESHGQLITGGSPMTEGRHYWEVEHVSGCQHVAVSIGVVRPGIHQDKYSEYLWGYDSICFMSGSAFISGAIMQLDGNSELSPARGCAQGGLEQGDRIGVLLDLDAGWMRFYRNGRRCGPGYTAGVTGPLLRASQLHYVGSTITVLPCAVAPEGAGGAGEFVDCAAYSHSLAELKDACRTRGLPVSGTKAVLAARLDVGQPQ